MKTKTVRQMFLSMVKGDLFQSPWGIRIFVEIDKEQEEIYGAGEDKINVTVYRKQDNEMVKFSTYYTTLDNIERI